MKKSRIIVLLLTVTFVAPRLWLAVLPKMRSHWRFPTPIDQSTTQDVEQALPAKSENMAKVVSIEDNNLTLILADMPEKPFEENASVPPSEQIQPSSSAGINKADSAEKPSLPLDKNLENLSFSGAEKTYTLSSDLVVTKEAPTLKPKWISQI